MGLQGPPYAVLSPLVADPPAPPGDPESSLFLTCHFFSRPVENKIAGLGKTAMAYRENPVFACTRLLTSQGYFQQGTTPPDPPPWANDDLAGFGHIPWTGCRRFRTPGWAGPAGSARDPRPLPHTDYMTEWFSPVY